MRRARNLSRPGPTELLVGTQPGAVKRLADEHRGHRRVRRDHAPIVCDAGRARPSRWPRRCAELPKRGEIGLIM
jgi:hypothetical protein